MSSDEGQREPSLPSYLSADKTFPAHTGSPGEAPPPGTGPVPAQSRKRRSGVRVVGEVIGGLALLGVGITIGSGGKSPSVTPPVAASSNPARVAATSAPPSPAPPVPSPNGTFQGSCNYTLGNDPVGGTAVATGDVQVTNTGNIGTIIRVKITWPQQGYAPLAMTKKIRLAAGANQDVQFHRPLSYNEISNLQNWQTGHNYQDGCTYNASIIGTFGQVQ